MSSADLDSELRKHAGETADSIMSAARAEAERLASDAERLVEEKRQAHLKTKEQEYESEARSMIAAERHEAMHALLLARTRLVERVMDQARSLLPETIRREAYRSRIANELRDALGFVDGANTIVRCPKAIEPAVREALKSNPNVRVEVSAEVGSGFTAVAQEGALFIDGTLETRLERLAPRLAIEIHAQLRES